MLRFSDITSLISHYYKWFLINEVSLLAQRSAVVTVNEYNLQNVQPRIIHAISAISAARKQHQRYQNISHVDTAVPKMYAILENEYVRLIFYTSKIRFPDFPSFFFPFHMYVVYKQICKRRKYFCVKEVPDKMIQDLCDKHSKLPNHDCLNCVIVSKIYKLEVELDDYARIIDQNNTRIVQILALDIPYDNIYIGETLRHNLTKDGVGLTARVSLLRLCNIQVADEVEICLINNHNDLSTYVTDTLLKNYFRGPKLVRIEDILTIDLKKYAPEFYFNNHKTNGVECIYAKCTKINDSKTMRLTYLCIGGETNLKQSAHVQDRLPSRCQLEKDWKFEYSKDLCEDLINSYPVGLENRVDMLEKAVSPFLKHKISKLRPVFLIQGSKGSGKNFVTSVLADKLGLTLFKVCSGDLSSLAYAQTEIKIKNALFKAKLAAPCCMVIDNFENFGKNNEGVYDQRIINYFKDELAIILSENSPPVFVFCVSNSKDLPADLGRIFLETFDFGAPSQDERSSILKWLIEAQFDEKQVDCDDLAGKTHGFLYEDLKALVYYAHKDRCGKNEKVLSADNFNAALDVIQSNYTESLGAPKVPKVQWSDVGGLGDVKHEIIRTINLPLKHPGILTNSGLKRSGILLYGPPGTGKTLMAKAVATECGLCFLSVKGPELLNMYVGQSEQNVRDVFERAREASPCIIFFDELDSLAPNRGISGDSGGVMDRVVSQLLSEMDGLNEAATIFIIGATNRPDLIDPALLRPGRFDKLLYVGPAQSHEAKASVLKALTRKFKLDKNVNLDDIVKNCPENISGADFYGVCSTAWMSAVRRLIKQIECGDAAVDQFSHEDVIVCTGDFESAVKTVKPSISAEDLLYFEKLKVELSANKK